MIKKNLQIVFLLLITSVSAQTVITKTIGDFSTLKVYNGIAVELIASTEQKVEITGVKATKVKIKQVDSTLKIVLRFPELFAEGKAHVKLYYNKEITTIDGNQGAVITGKGFQQDQLVVKAQERAFVNLNIKVKHLEVVPVSGGIIKLTGTAKSQHVSADLYGIYHGYSLAVSGNSTVKAGTGAKAEILAGESLNAKVNFGGSIFYKGNPNVILNKKVAGGIIQKRK